MEYNWFKLPVEKKNRWLKFCPRDTYRVVEPTMLSGLLPESLLRKFDSVVLFASGVENSDDLYFMANGLRVDANDSAIDQMPFGFGCLAGGNTTSGLLIQHGTWDGRTSKPPKDFLRHIQQSGVGNCYPLPVLPSQESGPISELHVPSQTDAFAAVYVALKSQYPD